MSRQRNEIIVKFFGECWHDFQETYKWGNGSDDWSFDKDYAKHQPSKMTTRKEVPFRGSLRCIYCKKSIILTANNPDLSTWEGFGWLLSRDIAKDVFAVINLTFGPSYVVFKKGKQYEHEWIEGPLDEIPGRFADAVLEWIESQGGKE